MQGLPSSSTGAEEATQVPLWQLSRPLQTLASSQATPSGSGGFEQVPVTESQVPLTWQASCAVQIAAEPALHVPLLQVSPTVQALPSSQATPFALAGELHSPVEGSQMPATWHWSAASHTLGLPEAQAPT